jgi:hypothetical protein
MAPITLKRLVKQLDKLKPKPDAARLKSHDYARRLARLIRQLRERGLDADRAAATAALVEALKRGAITAPMEAHLHNRLGAGVTTRSRPRYGTTQHRRRQPNLEGLSHGPHHRLWEG